jgi:8-oxo-dGTP pyrophosphatase MutT (NUDIX family)
MASAAQSQGIPNYLPPSHLGRLRGREQAAAVCYRVGGRGVEFLLVRTRGGRWTFPKGGIEPGLTRAQSAALEAFEEAGVHGRIELASFARYVRRAPSKSGDKSILVLAFLCEVLRLAKPQEPKRNRTWFPAEKAKRRLQEGRASECGAELAAVVDRAVVRVRRLNGGHEGEGAGQGVRNDTLQRVCFEAPDLSGSRRDMPATLAGYFRRQLRPAAAVEFALGVPPQKLLPGPTEPGPSLQAAKANKSPASPAARVTAIDGTRRASSGS